MAQRNLFIINPAAGAGRAGERWTHFLQELKRQDSSPKVVFTTQPCEATAIARDGANKYEQVIAVGGDGTVLEVAEGLLSIVDNQSVLGIVPLGTGNDVARAVGILKLDDARRSLAASHSRIIDVIEVRCQTTENSKISHALLFAGVGIVSKVVRYCTPFTKRLLGQAWSYRVGLLRALLHYQSRSMRIFCDGQLSAGQSLFLGASNAETAGGGMRIAPGALIDDGLLNVNLVGTVSHWEALKELRRLGRGQHTKHPKVRYFTAREIRIECDPFVEVAADGELIGRTPATFVVKPKALPVLMIQ